MNPLSFFSTTVAATLAARGFLRLIQQGENQQPLVEKTAIPSYVVVLLLALFLHRFAVKKAGTRRSVTLAAVLFALGSWGGIVALAVTALQVLVGIDAASWTSGDHSRLPLVVGLATASMMGRSLAVGVFLAGVHGQRIRSMIAWSAIFYALPLLTGLGLIAFGTFLKILSDL